VTHAIVEFSDNADLALDDQGSRMVKYDVRRTTKAGYTLNKSEWTF
jgi:hypothetical protein